MFWIKTLLNLYVFHYVTFWFHFHVLASWFKVLWIQNHLEVLDNDCKTSNQTIVYLLKNEKSKIFSDITFFSKKMRRNMLKRLFVFENNLNLFSQYPMVCQETSSCPLKRYTPRTREPPPPPNKQSLFIPSITHSLYITWLCLDHTFLPFLRWRNVLHLFKAHVVKISKMQTC